MRHFYRGKFTLKRNSVYLPMSGYPRNRLVEMDNFIFRVSFFLVYIALLYALSALTGSRYTDFEGTHLCS